MRFSIIVPMHDCQKTIGKVLRCFETQSFPSKKFEVICVDDKSKDDTAKIVKQAGTRVRLIKFSQNLGNGRVKNLAVRKARGEILFFVDDHLYLDKDALLNLDLLFNKYPHISGICGYYSSPGNSDANICRDVRRRTLYGKDEKEKEISLDNFSPFSICVGAIKKEIFDKLEFPEDFGQNSAEDTLLQINCHLLGKIFLYSPQIKGLHDHNLGPGGIFNKLITEIRGLGDLLRYFAKENIVLPYQYGFLSFPLLLLASLGLLFLTKFFFLFFFVFLVVEILLAGKCFQDKKVSICWRTKAFSYCFLEEIIKGLYLPYYLLKKADFKFVSLAKYIYQFLKWEKEKFSRPREL